MDQFFKKLPVFFFAASVICLAVLYGIVARSFGLFPDPQLRAALSAALVLADPDANTFLPAPEPGKVKAQTFIPDRINPGLIFVLGVNADRRMFAQVMDREGEIIHAWHPDWFEIWGAAGNFPAARRPLSQPGTTLLGAEILPSGDLIANLHGLSTIRLDACGNVQWKLNNLGHHSVHRAEDGNIWVSAERVYDGPTPFPNYKRPGDHSMLLQKLTPEGEILKSIEVLDVLHQNDLQGLMYLSTLNDMETSVSGDTFHLNDVKTFPTGLNSRLFTPGDLLFSLRNVNSILVIDPETLKVKFRATGQFLRQHDPDFGPNDTITLFDNHNLMPDPAPARIGSRVIEIDAVRGTTRVLLDGAGAVPFFSQVGGSHQMLPNGNILIELATEGRLLEFLPDGRLAWSYDNRVSTTMNGKLSGGSILPPEMDKAFFEAAAAACG